MIKSLLIAPLQGAWRARLPKLAAAALLALIVMARAPDLSLAQTAAPAAKPKAQAAPASESGLKARVDSLEEQLVDMQVLVGTLESLARQGGAGAPAARAGVGGADSVRVEALESQVRSLTQQVQALSDQVRSMGGTPRRSDVAPAPPPGAESFGTTSVQPGDSIGSLIEGDTVGAPGTPGTYGADEGSAGAPPPVTTAALPPPGELENPKQLYETAYGYLLQRDYGAAQVAFDDFLKKFPSDSLAGNAQYWLGESFFVRGQYKAAASAFLKGYQTYARSQKAPESLLKLAMSLDRLGQKDAACASYSELNTKFPNAPQNVKARAQSERQRVGCS
jgi:tol-pal system protein YbgF